MAEDVDTTQARIEELAFSCLEAFEREGEAAVARACGGSAADAAAVLALLRSLSRVGLLAEVPADDAAPRPGMQIGGYRLLQRLGGGGMGVVFLAEQQGLRRRVALKLLRPGCLDHARSRARFQREIEAISRLDHPAICTVHEAGEADGRLYLAMRYVEGETLGARLQRLRAAAPQPGTGATSSGGLGETLLLVEKLARALHHAHEQGVVHRDVKPGNVIVTPAGEPVLVDFGLAIASAADSALTLSGDVLGTPAYMAPEQVRGDRGAVDGRTDVYALGAVLYECLALRPPFTASTRDDLYRQILVEPPPDLRRGGFRLGGELWVVLSRALEKVPRRRFPTALEFAEELRRIRLHEPIRTKRPGLAVRGLRWCQRNPVAASVLGTTAAGLVVALLLLAARALEVRRYRALVYSMAAADVGSREPRLGFKLAREAVRLDPSPANCERLQQLLGDVYDVAVLDAGIKPRQAEYSPDGSRILVSGLNGSRLFTATGVLVKDLSSPRARCWASFAPAERAELVFGDAAGRVRIADLDGNEVRSWLHGAPVNLVLWSPDGGLILVADDMCRACLYAPDGARVAELIDPSVGRAHRHPLYDAVWDPEGRYVVTADGYESWRDVGNYPPFEARVWIWDREGRPKQPLSGAQREIYQLACRRDRIAAACMDGSAWLWDVSGSKLYAESSAGDCMASVEFDRAGELVVFAATRGLVCVVDRDGQQLRTFRPGGSVSWATFTPDGAQVVTASWRQVVQFFDLHDLQEDVLQLRGHAGGLTHVAFAPDGRHLVSTSWDGTARIWQPTPVGVRQFGGHGSSARHVVATADGERIVSSSARGDLIRRDRDGNEIDRLPGQGQAPWAVHVDRDGRTLLGVWPEGRIVLWDLHDDRPAREIAFPADGVWDAQRLEDGALVVAARASLYRWDPDRSSDPQQLCKLRDQAYCIALHPDGRLVLGTNLGDVVVVDRSGNEVGRLPGHSSSVLSVACSADGRSVLSASEDRTVRLWDLSTMRETRRFEGHQNAVRWAAFVPGSAQVVSASMDATSRLFDIETARTELILRGHRRSARPGFVTADGRQVVSASDDGTIRWWWLRHEDIVQAADALAVRLGLGELTAGEQARIPDLDGR